MQVIRIEFKNGIAQWEVPLFRGALIKTIGGGDYKEVSDFFHNHNPEDGKDIYRYPRIQYKRIHGKAALVAVGEGTEVLGQFFSKGLFPLRIGQREVQLEVERVQADRVQVQLWQEEFGYSLRKWLPLNQSNYGEYNRTEGVVQRCAMFESILTANMLSFLKGMGIRVEDELRCTITQLSEPYTITHKGVRMRSFDLEFKTNLSLPDFIGLGKGVSHGLGTVTNFKTKKK